MLAFNATTAQRQAGTAPTQHPDPSWASNVMLGVCAPAISSTGVTTLEPNEQQPSRLQAELLQQCGDLASRQLNPTDTSVASACMGEHLCEEYEGPVALLKAAHKSTSSQGSTKLLLTVLDNSTMIHGGREPMAAVLSVGDCRLMLLRRTQPKGSRCGRVGRFELTYSSDTLGEPGSPPASPWASQKRVPPAFQCLDKTGAASDEEAVERALDNGSTVRCITVRKGDILVLWSIGLGVPSPERAAEICTEVLGARARSCIPIASSQLRTLGSRFLTEACARLDASIVVAEVVEWTHAADTEDFIDDLTALPVAQTDAAAPFIEIPMPTEKPPVLPVVSKCKVVYSPSKTPTTPTSPTTPSTSTSSYTSAGFGPRSPMPTYIRAR